MNTITVTGNVGKDPELRFTQGGKAVAKFTVADTRGKGDDKQTTWHNVVCFDEQAENVCEQVKKGSRVLVQGRLNKDKYVDKDGNNRESVEIVADEICLSLRWKKTDKVDRLSNQFAGSVLEDEEPF